MTTTPQPPILDALAENIAVCREQQAELRQIAAQRKAQERAAANAKANGNGEGEGKGKGKGKQPTTADHLRKVNGHADALLADTSIPVADRLIHLRHYATDLGLNLRDADLQRKLWEARRRRSGAVEMFAPGMIAPITDEVWAWEGLILAGDTNLVAALAKVGKTSFLLDAIARWYRGDAEHLGRRFCGPCPPVFIAGTDMPRKRWLALLGRYGLAERRFGPDGKPSWYLPPDGPIRGLFTQESPIHLDADGIARLVEVVSNSPGCLLIVDSYARCVAPLGLKEASSDYAGPLCDLQEAIAAYGVTLVPVHHSGHSRAGEGAVAACRGTTALPAAASQIIALSWLNRAKGSTDKRVVLQTEGRGGEPLQLLLQQHDDGWQCHGDAAEAFREQQQQEAEAELHDRQADALEVVRDRWAEGHRTTGADLLKPLGLRGDSAPRISRRTLQQLVTRGLLQSSKESTDKGQLLWFWPAGEARGDTPPPLSGPPVPSVLSVPSSPPLNPEIPVQVGEGTLRTHRTRGTDNRERGHPGVPSAGGGDTRPLLTVSQRVQAAWDAGRRTPESIRSWDAARQPTSLQSSEITRAMARLGLDTGQTAA